MSTFAALFSPASTAAMSPCMSSVGLFAIARRSVRENCSSPAASVVPASGAAGFMNTSEPNLVSICGSALAMTPVMESATTRFRSTSTLCSPRTKAAASRSCAMSSPFFVSPPDSRYWGRIQGTITSMPLDRATGTRSANSMALRFRGSYPLFSRRSMILRGAVEEGVCRVEEAAAGSASRSPPVVTPTAAASAAATASCCGALSQAIWKAEPSSSIISGPSATSREDWAAQFVGCSFDRPLAGASPLIFSSTPSSAMELPARISFSSSSGIPCVGARTPATVCPKLTRASR
mmetsp:Transcript_20251/g.51143  ORF Transcript_20251/g.51143 Transcript_20251/m.51143 type:complete len:292 (+) Transcript_20251:211-1086(+)